MRYARIFASAFTFYCLSFFVCHDLNRMHVVTEHVLRS